MNIWLQSSVFAPTPAPSTAALEYIVAKLAAALTGRGHSVALFGLDGSKVPGIDDLITVPRYKTPWDSETALIDKMESRPKPDVIFDHSRFHLAQRRWPALPAVTMSHGTAVLEGYVRNPVFCSLQHGRCHGVADPVALHIAIDVEEFQVGPPMKERGAPLWIGRLMPYKRPHLAIDICERAGLKLDVAGPSVDGEYYRRMMEPRFARGAATYLGEVAGQAKAHFYSRALCLVFTSDDTEPSGTVMLEAMASGTPVFAFDHGANREYVRHGQTGYLAKTEMEFENALRYYVAAEQSPERCREHVERNFAMGVMAERAEGLLSRAAQGERW